MSGRDEREEWRVFCAVEIPSEVKEELGERAARLRERFLRVRASWERPEKMHLTMKFVGETERSRVVALSGAAERAAAGVGCFKLLVASAGVFPNERRPRVLWFGVEDDAGRLIELQRRLEDEASAAGFKRETRSFRPHLTSARIRDPRGARELAEAHVAEGFDPLAFEVDSLVVIRSELSPSGSKYTTISRHRL